MLKVAIQMSNLDCLLQSELWHFHRYLYFLRKVLAEARKRRPHLVQHTLRCECCPSWGSFRSNKDKISLCRLRTTVIITRLIGWSPGKTNPKVSSVVWWFANSKFHHLLRQSPVMPPIATQNMKITSSSTLQNIFQIDIHLWRNLLFLPRSLISHTLNICDVPDMATLADKLLFTFGVLQTSLLIQRKTVTLTQPFQVNPLLSRWNDIWVCFKKLRKFSPKN